VDFVNVPNTKLSCRYKIISKFILLEAASQVLLPSFDSPLPLLTSREVRIARDPTEHSYRHYSPAEGSHLTCGDRRTKVDEIRRLPPTRCSAGPQSFKRCCKEEDVLLMPNATRLRMFFFGHFLQLMRNLLYQHFFHTKVLPILFPHQPYFTVEASQTAVKT